MRLVLRFVAEPQRHPGAGLGRELVDLEQLLERRQPRHSRLGSFRGQERVANRADQQLEVCGGLAVELDGPDRDRRGPARDRDGDASSLLLETELMPPAVGDLHFDQLRRAGADVGAPGQSAGERSSDRRADNVHAVVAIVHPQRDAQVGVGANVVFDGTGRALRGQQEVHAQ